MGRFDPKSGSVSFRDVRGEHPLLKPLLLLKNSVDTSLQSLLYGVEGGATDK
jgi:hypothetical protein